MCNITKCCTEVCPEGIKITDNGIIPLKERVVDTKYDPVLFLGSKIGRRKERRTPVGPAGGGISPIKHPTPTSDVAGFALSSGSSGLAPAPPKSPSTADRAVSAVSHATSSAATATASAATATARSNKTLPAAGAAAGVGLLAWVLRRRHRG
jgi:hypothetical protein